MNKTDFNHIVQEAMTKLFTPSGTEGLTKNFDAILQYEQNQLGWLTFRWGIGSWCPTNVTPF